MIRSEVLGLDVCRDDELLRFRHPAKGHDIEHRAEVSAARLAAEARANRAEARIVELEAELKRLRADDLP